MAFDFKKEYKEFYMPKNIPEIVTVPAANYIAVRGKGNPNQEGGTYQQAVGILYAVAYTIKMSDKGSHKIEGFFEYVVPPLEGFWWQEDVDGVDYGNKDSFNWISVIRLPDFVTKDDFDWAAAEAAKKKKLDCSTAEFLTVEEGLCVQILHTGPFDDEPASVAIMDKYLRENGYVNDMTNTRLHHEIYLSDARKVEPSNWKTVIRHPIKLVSCDYEKHREADMLRQLSGAFLSSPTVMIGRAPGDIHEGGRHRRRLRAGGPAYRPPSKPFNEADDELLPAEFFAGAPFSRPRQSVSRRRNSSDKKMKEWGFLFFKICLTFQKSSGTLITQLITTPINQRGGMEIDLSG